MNAQNLYEKMVVFGKLSTTNQNQDKASKSCRDLQRGEGNGKGVTVAEICEKEREMAREKLLQRFAKRRGKWQLAREKLLQRFPKKTGVCLAREKKIQRFPKRTKRGLGRFCKPM